MTVFHSLTWFEEAVWNLAECLATLCSHCWYEFCCCSWLLNWPDDLRDSRKNICILQADMTDNMKQKKVDNCRHFAHSCLIWVILTLLISLNHSVELSMRVAVVSVCLLNQQNVDKLFNDSLILQFINVATKRHVMCIHIWIIRPNFNSPCSQLLTAVIRVMTYSVELQWL
jgi:hypothetical protein